jgi:predicted lipid-binding transport protein (Tim44 family)
VGLVALARWVADLYGPFAGLAAVGGLLLLVTLVLAVVAVTRPRPRSARRVKSPAEVLQSAAKRSPTYPDAVRRLHAAQAESAQAAGRTSPAAAAPQGGAVAGDLARSSAAAAATDRAKSFAGELEWVARRNPTGVIAGAVVIGVLIGVFGRRS